MIFQGSKRYPVKEIIVHCSATTRSWMAKARTSEKVAEIRRWHVEDNGWRDIGYHLVIDRDGTVAAGRGLTEIGAHVVGHNNGTLGICLIGGGASSAEDSFGDHFTDTQAKALLEQIARLKRLTRIERVSGHNQYAAKACPGFYVPGWLKQMGAA
ncbi:N-acetylmuramoyl-L-alanine amidase [Frigidibacter oleivorans]|uniref:N-acetylmuramoyl-L-alanine amidase n=1 Tax=Frigidibacter oleivorans TaxID=2487129 RepID=UPI00197AFAB3|nr:N-acetylmuramoyl-L-alanine amidase [Frigidibacter oleivorans]